MRPFHYLRAAVKGAVSMAMFAAISQALAAPAYRLTLLDSLAPQGGSDAWAINNLGEIAGSSWGEGFRNGQATLWTSNQEAIQLGPKQGQWSYAYGINDTGIVVGVNSDGSQNAVQWTGGTESILEWQTCCSGTVATANDVNDLGVVVGWTDNGATVWKNGVAQVLRSPTTRYNADDAAAVNNLNQIVGNGAVSTSSNHALMWQDDGVIDLGTAGAFKNSFARAINDHGDAVGASFDDAAFMGHATLWRDGTAIDLGTLTSGQGSVARGINIHGQIVGESHTSRDHGSDSTEALFWDSDLGRTFLLQSLIDEADPLKSSTHLTRALAINDSGVIVGTAIRDGRTLGFMLTPATTVPEASTLSLYLLGIAAVIGASRSSRKAV